MQYGLIYACEVSCTGEYSSPSGDGVQSTNHKEKWYGYGAVLSVMAGQILMTSSNQDTQACALNEHAISREKTHTLSWRTGLHKNVRRLSVRRNSEVITKVIEWDILLCICQICQSQGSVPAVHCYRTFVNLMTHKARVASLMWKQPSSPTPYIEEDCVYKS
jgi:hypothetical protein